MKRKWLCALLCLAATVMLFAVTASAETYGDLTYEVSIGEVTVTGCETSVSGALVIPAQIEGYPVTSIGYRAFYECSGLTSITIPWGVTSIGYRAFYGCEGLTSIEIPSSVTSIWDYAFEDCSGLTSVTFAEGSRCTSIGGSAFRGCSALTSIEIPSSVTSIGYGAFWNCSGLTSIEIPSSVTSIGSSAFWDCSGLTSIEIPSSVTSIGGSAFLGCSGLTSITILNPDCEIYDSSYTISDTATIYGYAGSTAETYANKYGRTFVALDEPSEPDVPDALTYEISDGEVTIAGCKTSVSGALVIPAQIEGYPVTSIGNYAFDDCSSLTRITIPSSVTSIGDFAFSGCWGLTSITLLSSVTSIGKKAFAYCESLTSIMIPSSVTSIGKEAFVYCSSLTSITIPSSVTSIGDWAFEDCSGLTSITVDAANPAYISDVQGVLYNKDKTTLICCPGGKTECEIPSSVTSIGYAAFAGCWGLASITIPSSVTSIEHRAFEGCNGLTSITIPSSVTSIKYRAFAYCGLTSIEILNPDCDIYDDASIISNAATIYGYAGSTAETYAKDYNRTFVALVPASDLNVTLPAGSAVTAIREESVTSGAAFDAISARAADKPFEMHSVTYAGAAELDGAADFTLDIPEGMNAENLKVYRIAGDFITDLAAAVGEDGKLHFTADHLDAYVIAEGDLVTYGDATGDGKITLSDTLRLLRHLGDGGVSMDIAAADYSGDESITVLDALLILRHGLDV